jgi:ubiquinone/menaquinone biosynthesis C-methylase UbiE
LELKPGMSVADIGAGTGLYTQIFAEAVGTAGSVHAVDISEPFLRHIARKAEKRGYKHITTHRGTQTSTSLPANAIDVAFVCDTYHHLEHPEKILASIHQALKPGGKLVVVEFDRHEKASEFVRKHVRASKDVFIKEIEAAGFARVPIADPPKLEENFVAVFRRVEPPAGPRPRTPEPRQR